MYTPDRIDNSILYQEWFYHTKSLNVEILKGEKTSPFKRIRQDSLQHKEIVMYIG